MDLKQVLDTELAYSLQFSQCIYRGKCLRLRDEAIPDMYAHNFSLFQEQISKDDYIALVNEELSFRKNEGGSFLRTDCDFMLDAEWFSAFPLQPEFSRYDLMGIETARYIQMHGNPDCTVIAAKDEKSILDGRKVDYLTSLGSGEDFAKRRSERKSAAYTEGGDLILYVCYYRGEPAGKVEFFRHNGLIKIEDFGVLDSLQRKGLGTATLRKLLQDASDEGFPYAYLITDAGDTAKDMYRKCGFDKIGERCSLHFSW